MGNLRVLHLLSSNKYSGAENVVCTIIKAFENEIDMFYCSPNGPISNILKDKNINYIPLEKFNRKNLKKTIKEYNPDIIHAHDYRASLLATMSGFKGKIISHLHINAPFAKNYNLKSMLYGLSIKKIDSIIGVSDAVYNEAIFKNKMKNKYTTIYNYVDKDLVIEKSTEYNYEKQYDLFFIGRLNYMKNPLQFIEIIDGIKKNKNDIKAVIIGDGELMDDCKNLINEKKLNDNIEMVGFINNPFPIIKNCKIGIMPSIIEGFGLTAIESLILDKPVLNSGIGGLREIFKDNKELICNSTEEYVQKIIELLNCNKQINVNLNKYIDKNMWKNKLDNIYKVR